jgi:hypothetical protein
MYDIYIGKQKSIVFPIMCNAHINIGYAENVPDILNTPSDTTDDIPYGIWSHEGSFTFEAIITPYDINGAGTKGLRGRTAPLDNDFIMPQGGTNKISEEYLSTADRYTHEMCLFHNDNFRVTLLNATTTNNNQPAEYKLKVYSTINSVQETFTSPVIISSSAEKAWSEGENHNNYNKSGFDRQGRILYDSIASVTTNYSTGTTIFVNTTSNHGSRAITSIFYDEQKVYKRDGFDFELIGTVASANATSITLDASYGKSLPAGTEIYVETFKEPKYVENMHHVAVSFSEVKNSITMFYNRRQVFSDTHSETGDFSFARTDCYIGKNTESDNDASTDMQYMGEIHEMSIERGAKKSIVYTNTLFPFYDETLLYLRFEEVDE